MMQISSARGPWALTDNGRIAGIYIIYIIYVYMCVVPVCAPVCDPATEAIRRSTSEKGADEERGGLYR